MVIQRLYLRFCENKKKTALPSFRQCNKNPQQNLSKKEIEVLTILIKNKDIVIQTSEKCISFVILNNYKIDIKRMENLRSDEIKFEKITLKNEAFLKFVGNQEKHIENIFKNQVDSNSMSKEMYKYVKPVGTMPVTMYGFCEIHKQQVDGCHPLSPPFSANLIGFTDCCI